MYPTEEASNKATEPTELRHKRSIVMFVAHFRCQDVAKDGGHSRWTITVNKSVSGLLSSSEVSVIWKPPFSSAIGEALASCRVGKGIETT
jgi:hypothetical protein